MKLFSVLMVLIWGSFAAAQVTSYPLTCNFGGDGASWRPSPAKPSNLLVYMSFKHSDKPAAAGVPEGYCAWQDRGMSPNEPTTVLQEQLNITSIYEVEFKGQTLLVTAPSIWAAKAKVKGTIVTFKVHAEVMAGSPDPVFKIDN